MTDWLPDVLHFSCRKCEHQGVVTIVPGTDPADVDTPPFGSALVHVAPYTVPLYIAFFEEGECDQALGCPMETQTFRQDHAQEHLHHHCAQCGFFVMATLCADALRDVDPAAETSEDPESPDEP